MTVSPDAELRALIKLKQAAMDLSAACIEDITTNPEVSPLVAYYDLTVMDQETDQQLLDLLKQIH